VPDIFVSFDRSTDVFLSASELSSK